VLEIPVEISALKRVKENISQTGKDRYERWVNVSGIFEVIKPVKLEGKHILLIDDVVTTGSTLEACAGEILKVERAKVSVATIAAS